MMMAVSEMYKSFGYSGVNIYEKLDIHYEKYTNISNFQISAFRVTTQEMLLALNYHRYLSWLKYELTTPRSTLCTMLPRSVHIFVTFRTVIYKFCCQWVVFFFNVGVVFLSPCGILYWHLCHLHWHFKLFRTVFLWYLMFLIWCTIRNTVLLIL